MSRRRNNPPAFVAGDIAECTVDWYSSVRLGQQFVVLGTHTTSGELVLEVKHPSFGGVSTYYAKNFRNLSRALPLFHQKETSKMSVRKVHIVIPFFGAEPDQNTIKAAVDAQAANRETYGVTDGYQQAVNLANSLVSGGGKALILSAVAVVEPVPSTRVRQL